MPRKKIKTFFVSNNGRNATLIYNRDGKEEKAKGKRSKKDQTIPTNNSEKSFQLISDGI